MISACSGGGDLPAGAGAQTPVPGEPPLLSSPTPTTEPIPPRLLTICLGSEPASLFLYGENSNVARIIRQAIYDGPTDLVNYQVNPVILEKRPALADGDVLLQPVQMAPNDLIMDSQGKLTPLVEGTTFFPSGCDQVGCAQVYQGQGTVSMDQLVVRFRLRPGLQWSDGAPLTADDSVFSYEIARGLAPRARSELLDRTVSYTSLDAQTVEWRAIPGWRDPDYASNFFSPLPRHILGALTIDNLLADPGAARSPLGWGPYIIQEWKPGESISLARNPNYWRSQEGLPRFDQLVFRFIDSDQGLRGLESGQCDILDETSSMKIPLAQLQELEGTGKVGLALMPGAGWEQLVFGILPYAPSAGWLPIFQAKEVRQAIAQCLDREKIQNEFSASGAVPADSYISSQHPLYNPNQRRYAYDPAAANASLESFGWRDTDGDPATPRLAFGVPGIPDGAPFAFDLLIANDPEKIRLGGLIQASLAGCGIQSQVIPLPVEQVYAPGPDGPVFGRNFSAAQFGWASGDQPACAMFTTQEIPGPYPDFPKGWGGANASGYSNPQYDLACQQALDSLPDSPGYQAAHYQAQALFAEDLPAIPLYIQSKWMAMRPDLCGLEDAGLSGSNLWNLEGIDYGEGCSR